MTFGLVQIPTVQLRMLRDAIREKRMTFPIAERDLSASGIPRDSEVAEVLRACDQQSAIALLNAIIAERDSKRTSVDLVWTGPNSLGSTSRDTAMVIVDLFQSATESVLLAGYSFDHGETILRPLYDAMVQRNVKASLFLDVPRARHQNDTEWHAISSIDEWLGTNWPFGKPTPEIYYCPETATSDSRMSLHAKCLIVDSHTTLVTSANFTERGQNRNIEVGALVEDKTFAKRLAAQWYGLVSEKKMVRYG